MIVAIIPAWNEAGAIGTAIAQLPRPLIGHVIVMDGGSTDTTRAEAEAAGAEVITQRQRGYGAACAEGAAAAVQRGATVLLFLDGDGADAGERAADIVGPILQDQADFVIATRARAGRQKGSMLWHQVLAGHLIGRAIGWSTGLRYRDMAAFRALRPETLAALGMQQMGYGWNLEMQMRAANLRVLQVDMPYRCRIAGQSKVAGNLRGTIKASFRILATLVDLSRELSAKKAGARR